MPVPANTTATPAAPIEVGVIDDRTGRVANVTQAAHVAGRETELAQVTVTSAAVCEPEVRSALTEGWLAFQRTHSAASERPTMQATNAHDTPATDAAASCGIPTPSVHSPTPASVMLMAVFGADCAGGSSCSSVLTARYGVDSNDGNTSLTLNAPPASCTTTATFVVSEAGVPHDSVVNDSHAGCVHGMPANHTTRLSMVACGGADSPAAVQSAAVSRGAGSRSTMRPTPGVDGANPMPPRCTRAICGGGINMTVMFSRCGTPPVPA